ncbi:MAG TPA: TlpA disulfide reductase family protein [Gemmatimonadales bacterium]|jgi:thiol-disulfide isomerase/thioredoxin|nr:TlpA disulfide reductase family protein [Gemmatimonadales bacterium]
MRVRLLALLLSLGPAHALEGQQVDGPWSAALDLAGGPLRFSLYMRAGSLPNICNGDQCSRASRMVVRGDSVLIEIADYAATINARIRGDSLVGTYRNVGNRGPRVIPFRATRGNWRAEASPRWLTGKWDAWFVQDGRKSPRVLEFRNTEPGLEGTVLSNTGDYGLFWGHAVADSFSMGHFDGSFVYMLTGRLDGDTLRGLFHAGLRTQTPWVAVRSTGQPHLKQPTEITGADTSSVFRFSFPDLNGHLVTQDDARFRGKVLLVDIFGTWCPTCHDAAPLLTRLWNRYHDRGFEIVGLAYEVTGDSAADGKQLRIFRDKFGIPYPLLLAGVNDTQAAALTQPQLLGFTSFPTSIFIGRDGKVKKVHAGFWGPATGPQHEVLVHDFERTIERLLAQ